MASEIAAQQFPAPTAGHLCIALADSAGVLLIATIGTRLGRRPDSLAASRAGCAAARGSRPLGPPPLPPPEVAALVAIRALIYFGAGHPGFAHRFNEKVTSSPSALAGFRAVAVDPYRSARSPT